MEPLPEFGQLSGYDVAGYFIPGAVLLLVVMAFFSPQYLKVSKRGWIPHLLVLVLAAYVVGHMIQAVASPIDTGIVKVLHDPQKRYFEESTDEFQQHFDTLVENTFGIKHTDKTKRHVFFLCSTYCRNHDIDGFIEIMESRYGLYRGLYVAFLLSTCALLAPSIGALVKRLGARIPAPPKSSDGTPGKGNKRSPEPSANQIAPADAPTSGNRQARLSGGRFWIVVIVLAMLAGLSFWRCWSFSDYLVDHTYRTFYVHAMAATQDQSQP